MLNEEHHDAAGGNREADEHNDGDAPLYQSIYERLYEEIDFGQGNFTYELAMHWMKK